MENSRKQMLLERARHAEFRAKRVTEPGVQQTMLALAALYRNLAESVDELAELKARARALYYSETR
jgi:hypothetical protein